ncbi:MAG: MBL fold metallo-hydrolase [Acidimicrobiia bacterium]|nr:MBL fold metallo-hydrolase [Acidimicrobiia bacterium]MBT8216439.1 MBL fold metallo-hydrolase [Acidimicrobiia bacterium]NNF09716.1 MBL fold metallo-hydrolase [Acidimicrobiia bacterium]NNL71394.1 MBL fold metallo-hydrolase [Acidimicrobiia bacterium]
MEAVANGVYQVKKGFRSFVIDGDEGLTLVDTGLPRRAGAVTAVIDSIGRSVDDVRAIVLTHSHMDHAGNAAELKRASGAELYCAPGDAPAVQGDEAAPTPPFMDRPPFGMLKPLFGLMPAGEPAGVDHEVNPGVVLTLPEDLVAVPTPGHTPGHTSYRLDRAGGILFVGDAASHRRGSVARGWFNRPTPAIDGSVQTLAELEFAIACFGHADPLTSRASAAFREFARSL